MIIKKVLGQDKCTIQGDELITNGKTVNILGLQDVTANSKDASLILTVILIAGLVPIVPTLYFVISKGVISSSLSDLSKFENVWNLIVFSMVIGAYLFVFWVITRVKKYAKEYRSFWSVYLDRPRSFFCSDQWRPRGYMGLDNINPNRERVSLLVEKKDDINIETKMKELEIMLAQKRALANNDRK